MMNYEVFGSGLVLFVGSVIVITLLVTCIRDLLLLRKNKNKDETKVAFSISKEAYEKLVDIQERMGAKSASDALFAIVLMANALLEDNTVEIVVEEETSVWE